MVILDKTSEMLQNEELDILRSTKESNIALFLLEKDPTFDDYEATALQLAKVPEPSYENKDIDEEQFLQKCQNVYEGGEKHKRNFFLHQEKFVGKHLPKFRSRNENLLEASSDKLYIRQKL
ncbi:hypothetical protein TNCV_697471 [Trichonephila clavipes]|nr:hypothetical protein TNCV_697471 [Trichonephila clavipes]